MVLTPSIQPSTQLVAAPSKGGQADTARRATFSGEAEQVSKVSYEMRSNESRAAFGAIARERSDEIMTCRGAKNLHLGGERKLSSEDLVRI